VLGVVVFLVDGEFPGLVSAREKFPLSLPFADIRAGISIAQAFFDSIQNGFTLARVARLVSKGKQLWRKFS
jgi:hypothetical protein